MTGLPDINSDYEYVRVIFMKTPGTIGEPNRVAVYTRLIETGAITFHYGEGTDEATAIADLTPAIPPEV